MPITADPIDQSNEYAVHIKGGGDVRVIYTRRVQKDKDNKITKVQEYTLKAHKTETDASISNRIKVAFAEMDAKQDPLSTAATSLEGELNKA